MEVLAGFLGNEEGGKGMKALNELQKQAYEVVEEWLRPQMMDTKIIYMSDCPAPELKHLPIRGLSAMVQRLNKKLDVNYKLGAEDRGM